MQKSRILLSGIVIALLALFWAGCTYDVPITPAATRKIEERVLGNWTATDGKDKMRIRKLDDQTYVLTYNGDLFRAYHSDVGTTALASVQDIDSAERKYLFVTYQLESGGRKLIVRSVSQDVVPKSVKSSTAVQELVRKNTTNADLFDKEVATFIRDP